MQMSRMTGVPIVKTDDMKSTGDQFI
ncbi:hypothetical protein KL86PLE_41390 [uncultured Pleomorphomonas sp.]|uniref:Uncharacterized protein n=1 Tax=uncultured Pleomorphomonas sp. TaxID=442121 RepID=A0A212LJ55_9HYPH|nr:hypothetical protein KL86PLE_41390 [uncultured Pleomorphomonas sp.]